MYKAKLEGTSFTNIQNLGPGINTPSDEMYFSVANHRLFLCSNRPGGSGRFDLYSYGLEEKFEALSKGGKFVSRAIHFDFDKSELKKESLPFLDDLAAYLIEESELRVRITGHTDVSGKNHTTGSYRLSAPMLCAII